MPNYSLVSNAVFQPFSYQELLAPVMHQQQVQDQLAEQYEKLSSQADILEAMGANDRDSKAYRNFKNYSDNLRTEADNLYRNGLNSESRLRLSELKRRYNSEIVPIQNAWNKREEEAQMQMKASIANPMIRFTRDASRTSLDQYLANPSGGYGVINLANIASQMGAAAKNLTNQLRGGVEVEGIDDFTKRHITKYGIDATVVNQWIKDPSKNPALTNMMNQVLATNGLTEDVIRNNPNLFAEATQAAQSGAWNAIGKEESQIVPDYYRRAMLDFDLKERAANNEYARKLQYETAKAQAAGNDSSTMPDWAEERAGIKTADGYVTNAPEIINQLKAGNNALKASYFGKYGQVNPLQVYEDYEKELKKNTKRETVHEYGTTMVKDVADEEAARKAIAQKYGIKDIITKDQYNILSGMGYNNKSSFRKERYNNMEQRLNKLATQYTRYSTKMTGYDLPDESIRTNLMRMNDKQFRSGMMFDMKEDGGIGDPIKKVSNLDLKTNDNSKGNQVSDIQYDPQHKGKILITFAGGKKAKRVIASPDVIDAKLTRAIGMWEAQGYDPRVITGMIANWLNTYNKQQGKTGNS